MKVSPLLRQSAALFMAVFLAIGTAVDCTAASAAPAKDSLSSEPISWNSDTPVRVARFAMGDYFITDDLDEVVSYDSAYLDELSTYSSLSFTFVDCGSWDNALKMLKEHKVDLVGTAQPIPAQMEEYSFCSEKYGITYSTLAVLPQSKIAYEDYNSIANASIGCTQDYVRLPELLNLLQAHGISEDHIVYYPNFTALSNALENGSVDVIAASAHALRHSWKAVEKFSYSPFYFMSWKGNEGLTQALDSAILEAELYDPSFQNDALTEYFPDLVLAPFTRQELDYIAAAPPIDLVFEPDTAPLAWADTNGTMRGVLIDQCLEAAKKAGLNVSFRAAADGEEDDPNDRSYSFALSLAGTKPQDLPEGACVSSPVFSGDFYLYGRVRQEYLLTRELSGTIAVPGNRSAFEGYLTRQYPKCTIRTYSTPAQCLEALRRGQVDLAFLNHYVASNYITRRSIDSIIELPASSISFDISIVFTGEDAEILCDIFSKSLARIPTTRIQQTVQDYALQVMPDVNISYLFGRYPLESSLIALLLLLALLLLAIWMLRYRLARRERETLTRANAELALASAAKTDFLSRMSHDIRTPMNAIIGTVDFALKDVEDPVRVRDELRSIRSSSEFLLGLINDILDMSRIEKGLLKLHPEPYDYREFLRVLHSMFDPLCEEKGITLTIEPDTSEPFCVMADKVRMNQVFFNLLSNAVKFTPAGGTVSFRMFNVEQHGETFSADFEVCDNGCGMSDTFLQHLYEPFSQEDTASARRGEGSGLGLAIARQIVSLMGGAITVESELNVGTRFYLHLEFPLAKETDLAEKVAVSESSGSLKGRHVLLVEDNAINTRITSRQLTERGLVVSCAADGAQALKIFSESKLNTFDLILMDVRMPVMDGLEATRAIRALTRADAATVPILALSANAYEEDIARSLEAGMNGHLSKPISPDTLYAALAKWISN